jgi:putative ABC transport system permease protein
MKHALRRLLASPGFTVTALVTLALGIGANTSMFSMLRTLAVRTLPYPDEGRLFYVHRTSEQAQNWPHSVANYLDLHAQQTVFERIAAFNWATFALALPGEPAEQIRGLAVTADFFPLLGTAPALGRVFTAEEARPGQDRVIVLSHRFWRARFAAAADIIGREVRVGNETVTVIGVMPPSFEDPLLWGPTDAWRPLTFSDAARANRRANYLRVIGRLKPALSSDQAETGIKTLWAQLVAAHDTNAKTNLRLAPLNQGSQIDDGPISWFIFALAALVLLIACANLANLQFARTAVRAREHAIRAALGATRGRLMRDVLAESVLLALVGGSLGVLVALWSNDLLGRQLRINTLQGVDIPLDFGALAFAFIVSATAGVAFGLLPAWLAARTDVNDALKQGGRGVTASRTQNRIRHGLIVVEVALALVLLATASLFIGGLKRVRERDPGWRVAGLLTASFSIQLPRSMPGPEGNAYRLALVQQLEEKIAALPGVERVAFGTALPTYGFGSTSSFLIEGQPAPAPGTIPQATNTRVTPGYFATLGVPLIAGRAFTAHDRGDTSMVTVINEKMARAFFPGESALGKRLRHPDDPAWREIVGIVGDALPAVSLGLPEAGYQMYRPLAQNPGGGLELVLRAQGAAETLAPAVRRIVASLNPDQVIESPDLLGGELKRAMSNIQLGGWMLGAFAALGLLLAALGIYAVVANSVVQRTNEIGVRMALGAQVRDILQLVLVQGLRLAILGTVLGLAGALGAARVLRAAAPALAEIDFAALTAVMLTLVSVAALACYLPARRATKIDPLQALRAE